MVRTKNDAVIGGDRQPTVGLDFGVELPRRPPGIAQGEKALARPLAFADRTQDIEGCGHRDIAVDDERRRFIVIGGVQHEAAPGFDRTAEIHRTRVGDVARRDVELRKQLTHRQRAERLVDHKAHRPGIVAVGTKVDHRTSEALIQHLRHRDQQLARQRAHCALHRNRSAITLLDRAPEAYTSIHWFCCASAQKNVAAMPARRSGLPATPSYVTGGCQSAARASRSAACSRARKGISKPHTTGGTHTMTIKVGDKIPSATLKQLTPEGPKEVTTDELFGGK